MIRVDDLTIQPSIVGARVSEFVYVSRDLYICFSNMINLTGFTSKYIRHMCSQRQNTTVFSCVCKQEWIPSLAHVVPSPA